MVYKYLNKIMNKKALISKNVAQKGIKEKVVIQQQMLNEQLNEFKMKKKEEYYYGWGELDISYDLSNDSCRLEIKKFNPIQFKFHRHHCTKNDVFH